MFIPIALTCVEAVNTSTELFHQWRGDLLAREYWLRKSIHGQSSCIERRREGLQRP